MNSAEGSSGAAKYYNKWSNFQRDVAHQVLDKQDLQLQDAKLVLDLGCGTGNMTVALLEHLSSDCKIIAVDPDLKRIKVAQDLHGCHGNVTFQAGSSDSFPSMGKEVYDAVVCHFVLHWIKDQEAAFKNTYASMKPGGRLAMTYPVIEAFDGQNSSFYRWLENVAPSDKLMQWRNSLNFILPSKVEDFCFVNGFSVLSHIRNEQFAKYESVEAVIKYVFASTNETVDLRESVDRTKANNPPPCDERGEIARKIVFMTLVARK